MGSLFEKLTAKKLLYISLIVVGYFVLLYLNTYVVKSDFVLIGVFQELLTIPLLFIVQPGLLVLSIFHCIRDRFRINTCSFWAFIILLINNIYTIGSIIIR